MYNLQSRKLLRAHGLLHASVGAVFGFKKLNSLFIAVVDLDKYGQVVERCTYLESDFSFL